MMLERVGAGEEADDARASNTRKQRRHGREYRGSDGAATKTLAGACTDQLGEILRLRAQDGSDQEGDAADVQERLAAKLI